MSKLTSRPGTEPPPNLLLVEDDANDEALFCGAAAHAHPNLRIRIVKHGQEAVNYLEGAGDYANRTVYPLPDVVVLDLRMPVVDGFEFLAWRRRSPIFSVLPVVAISGSVDQAWGQKALALGADRFFEKGLSLAHWVSIIRAASNLAHMSPFANRIRPSSEPAGRSP